ncbi:MAG: exo-alpha-sialidase [Ignavibacteriae bacterium]|nr:exo-alpha-sialidase [Ignavibacteriota bacterium]
MKNTITALLTVLALIILNITFNVSNSPAQWQPDVRLTNAPDSSRLSYNNGKCLASNGNYIHVVWYDKRDGNSEIYYKRSSDGGINWGADARLTNSTDFSFYPCIAVSGSLLHVAWVETRDGNNEIYYKRSTDAGVNWGADSRITSDSAISTFPSIATVGNFVCIAFSDTRNNGKYEIYSKYSTDTGVNWDLDTRLTYASVGAYYPSVSISGSNVHIVWYDNRDGNSEIYYKRSTDGCITWGADTRLTNALLNSNWVSSAVLGSNVHIVWYDNRDGNNEIYYKRSTDAGVNWSADTRLTNDPANSVMPNIALSGSNVHIVWYDYRDGSYAEIYYKLSTDGGNTWSVDTRLTYDPATTLYPFITVSNSIVHVAWSDIRDGNMEIYYKRNPTGNPTGISQVNPEIPKEYKLMQNYPNPFNPVTKINFDIAKIGFVSIIVYDALGKEVVTLVNKVQSAGSYSVDFNASYLSGGVYFCRMQSAGFTDVIKLVLLK